MQTKKQAVGLLFCLHYVFKPPLVCELCDLLYAVALHKNGWHNPEIAFNRDNTKKESSLHLLN